MNLDTVYAQYCKDRARQQEEFKKWDSKKSPYAGFLIDYNQYAKDIMTCIELEYNLSDTQANYIYWAAYERYHSSFGDMFDGIRSMIDLITKYPR